VRLLRKSSTVSIHVGLQVELNCCGQGLACSFSSEALFISAAISGLIGGCMLKYIDVTKRYGDVAAVNGVSLEVEGGRVTALLGPNGSGKSTLMKMAIGVVKPDSGMVEVDGVNPAEDPCEARRLIGYSPEDVVLYESLTPAEVFSFLGEVYEVPGSELERRVRRYVRLFKLGEEMGKLCGELSRGNRRKVSLVSALLHEPRILVLDEPFTGLDPKSARVLKELMRKMAYEGRVVLFSTHILELAEAVAERVVIMHRGRVAAEGEPSELREELKASDLEDVFMRATGLSEELEELVKSLWGE